MTYASLPGQMNESEGSRGAPAGIEQSHGRGFANHPERKNPLRLRGGSVISYGRPSLWLDGGILDNYLVFVIAPKVLVLEESPLHSHHIPHGGDIA